MIHLIVGNTGAGKTTYAHELQKSTNGIVFSIDQWNNTLFMPDKRDTDGLEWFLERIERAETMMLEMVHQLEATNTDSILDLGLSKYAHRKKFRGFARENGYEVKLHFLDVAKETRWQRVLERNKQKGATYQFDVSKSDFEFMEQWFETPTQEETANGVVVRG